MLVVLRDAVVTVLEVDPTALDRSTLLGDDLRADSLAVVEIVEIVEEQLAARLGRPVRLPDEHLDALRTLGDAVDQVLAAL